MPELTKSAVPQSEHYATLCGLSDEDVYERFRLGEAAALKVLYDRHVRMLRRLALNILGDVHESEDVAQDVFAGLWKNRDSWRQCSAKFSTWLHRVAINKAIDRKRRLRQTPVASEEIVRLVDASAPHASGEESFGDISGHRRILAALLQQLPVQQKRALALFYFSEMDVAAIATELSISDQAVRGLLKRARATLRAGFAADDGAVEPGGVRRLAAGARP